VLHLLPTFFAVGALGQPRLADEMTQLFPGYVFVHMSDEERYCGQSALGFD
jgi:hypothetical protein